MNEEFAALGTAIVTAILTALAAHARGRKAVGVAEARIAELEHEQREGESGRLWRRVEELERKIDELETSRQSCLDKLRGAESRIAALEARLGYGTTVLPPRLGEGHGSGNGVV